LDHWHEGAFLFGVISSTVSGATARPNQPSGAEIQAFPGQPKDNIKPFSPVRRDGEDDDDDNEPA
jgi:hypothetical protein